MIHHDTEQLLVAGAILDDLEPAEAAAYEAHRGGCTDCRHLELELDLVLADLALVVPERIPPADLLGGIRRALAGETAVQIEAGAQVAGVGHGRQETRTTTPVDGPTMSTPAPAPVVPMRRASRRFPYASLALAAALGVVAVGLGARSIALQQDLDRATVRAEAAQAALAGHGEAMTVALNPSHVEVRLHAEAMAPDAQATVVFVPGTQTSWIVARNLPATPSGHGYQLWYADAAGVHPLQTVAYDGSGTFVAPIGVDLADSAAVMITLEQAGGATGDPGPQVVFGEL
jgi:hypothetical protein